MQRTQDTKAYSFFFHFNKPASQREGKVQVSVHYKDTCHIVDNVECKVHCEGRISKRQPRFAMRGKAERVTIKNNIAVIE